VVLAYQAAEAVSSYAINRRKKCRQSVWFVVWEVVLKGI